MFILDISKICAKSQYELLDEDDKMMIAHIQAEIMTRQREKYLNKHPYSTYQGKDGKWYTTLPDKEKGRKKVKRNTKKEVDDIVVNYWKDAEENPTIEELFYEWNDLRLERKKIGKASHSRYAQCYRRHFGKFGKEKIKSISPEDVEEFLEFELSDKELSAKAFSSLKTVTTGILKRAKRRKLISFNLGDLLDDLDVSDHDFKKTVKEDCFEVFNEEETALFKQYCLENLDMRNTAIMFMFVTGVRVGELVAIKHEDIRDGTVMIKRTETKYENPDGNGYIYEVKDFPKTKAGFREVVVPKDYWFLLTKMKAMNPFGDYVFADDQGKRITTNVIRRRQERICRKLGIRQKSPHKVRKTVSTILLDEKLDNNIIVRQMGWTNIMTGENHYHRNRKSVDKKIEIISGIPEFQITNI